MTNEDAIGNFQIIEKVGAGGMATVYKAHQPRLDRHVAVKVMHQSIATEPNFLARFEREARIIARLDHPHIVPIYDYDDLEGQPFLVMKYVEGRTLKDILKEGPMAPEEALRIVDDVADALQYAHEQGVLHRDIKPSNIMIDNRGIPYLTDFGLARLARSGESTMSTDVMLGTPHYISPEQAQGNTDLDARTDVYSLGIVLYELVTGRVPFAGDTSYSIIHDQINTPPPPPREVNPDVPAAVEAVLLKALAKDRDDRYPTPNVLVAAYKEAVEGEQMQPPPSQVAPKEKSTPVPEEPTSFVEHINRWGERFGARMERFGDEMDRLFSHFDEEVPEERRLSEAKRRFQDAWKASAEVDTEVGSPGKKRKNDKMGAHVHAHAGKAGKKDKAGADDYYADHRTPEERIRRRVEKRMKQQREELSGLLIHLFVFFVINSWLFGLDDWISNLITDGYTGLPSFITLMWGIGLVAHLIDYLTSYGPGYRRRQAAIDREVERERQRMTAGGGKRKNETLSQDYDAAGMRLTDEGELTESYVDELQNKRKR